MNDENKHYVDAANANKAAQLDEIENDIKTEEQELEEQQQVRAELDYVQAQSRFNRKQRRAMYSTPSRSKPYARKPGKKTRAKTEAVKRGSAKINSLIERGIKHNQKVVVVVRKDQIAKAVSNAVKK